MALVPGGGLPFGIKRMITGEAVLKYLRRLLRLARSLRRGLRGVGDPFPSPKSACIFQNFSTFILPLASVNFIRGTQDLTQLLLIL